MPDISDIKELESGDSPLVVWNRTVRALLSVLLGGLAVSLAAAAAPAPQVPAAKGKLARGLLLKALFATDDRYVYDHLTGTYEPEGPTDHAAAACAKIRMRLPSNQDFVSLQRAFELRSPPSRDGAQFSEDGIVEFHKVFWDATEFVWSSTKSKDGRWGFVSADGFLETAPGYAQRVVCIAR